MRAEGGQYYVKSPKKWNVFSICAGGALRIHTRLPEMSCEIEFGVTKLPKFDVPEGYTSWEYLNELCFKVGGEHYEAQSPEELKERLNYKLSTIQEYGLCRLLPDRMDYQICA